MAHWADADQYRGYDFDPIVGLYLPGRGSYESAMEALAPSYQFRADTVTLSAGNVATISNRRGADALVVSAGTLAAPAANVLLTGAQSIEFTGTQDMASNLPASAWKFLHDGTGAEYFLVIVPKSVTGANIHVATVDGSVTRGVQIYTSSAVQTQFTASGSSVSMPGGSVAVDSPTYFNGFVSSTDPFKAQLFLKDASTATNTTLTFSAADPNGTLYLGSRQGTSKASMSFAELLIFPRVLHEYERQIVREYIAARYGIAAPSLTGADRDIMSVLPFSWLDPAAYSTSGGKVTAFLDRARPGHTFAQGTTGQQAANPTADAAFSNQLSAAFLSASTTRYVSSLAAAAWALLHNGLGGESFTGAKITAGATGYLWGTGGAAGLVGGTQTGSALALQQSVGQFFFRIANGTANMVNTTPVSAFSLNQALCVRTKFLEGSTPEWLLNKSGVAVASGNATPTAVTTAPTNTLAVGTDGAGGFPLSFNLAFDLKFNRALNTNDYQKLAAALLAKYGVAA